MENKIQFVQLGDARIKLSNIKNYGIQKQIDKTTVTVDRPKDEVERDNMREKIIVEEKFRAEQEKRKQRPIGEKILGGIADVGKGLGVGVVGAVGGGVAGGVIGEIPGAVVGVIVGGVAGAKMGVSIGKPEKEMAKKVETQVEKTIEVDNSYLYITTYQNDNFQFFVKNAPFDIYEKCKEIDSYLISK